MRPISKDSIAQRGRGARARTCCLLFLGSTIGNFDREPAAKFLSDVRSRLDQEMPCCSERIW